MTEQQEDNPGTFPNTTYSLDGNSPVRFAGIPSGAPQYQQLFYQSPPLPNMEHTLVGTCADEGSMVWLDYFVVEMTIGPSTSPLSGVATHTVTSMVIAASAPAVSAAHTTTSPIGAIVGGIVGVFALLLLMLAFFLWYRRYQHETPKDVPEDVGPETHVMRGHPFQVLQSSSPAATPRPDVLSATPSTRLTSIHEAPVDNNAYASERASPPEPQVSLRLH